MFVECVKDTSENKVVRVGSSALFSGLKDNSKRCNKFTCEYFEAYTIKDLKRISAENGVVGGEEPIVLQYEPAPHFSYEWLNVNLEVIVAVVEH